MQITFRDFTRHIAARSEFAEETLEPSFTQTSRLVASPDPGSVGRHGFACDGPAAYHAGIALFSDAKLLAFYPLESPFRSLNSLSTNKRRKWQPP